MPKPDEVRPDDFYMQFAPDPAAGKTVHLANDIILAPGGMQELLRKQKKRQLTGGMGDQTLEETLLEVLCEVETNGCPLAKWLREQNGWAPLDVSGIKREMRRQVEAVQLESALRQDHAIITAILQAQKRGAHHPSSRSPLAGAGSRGAVGPQCRWPPTWSRRRCRRATACWPAMREAAQQRAARAPSGLTTGRCARRWESLHARRAGGSRH